MPFLSLTTVFVLIFSVTLLEEQVSGRGVTGIGFTLTGNIILWRQANKKQKDENTDKKVDLESGDRPRPNLPSFLPLSIKQNIAIVYMVVTCLVQTATTLLDKYLITNALHPLMMFTLQRSFISAYGLIILAVQNSRIQSKQCKQITWWVFVNMIFEVAGVNTYYFSLRYIAASYTMAIKRAGLVLLSHFAGLLFFKEPLSFNIVIANLFMALGIVIIMLT